MPDHRKHILLIGAGHGHLNVIRDAHRWPKQVRATVLAPRDFWYSGLATGVLGGQFEPRQDCVDVADLCRRVGVDFMDGRMASLDPGQRVVHSEDGQALRYDVASLNLGSQPVPLPGAEPDGQRIFAVKPLRMLTDLRRTLEARERQRVLVIGGGYSGSECTLNLARLTGNHDVTLLTRSDRPASDLPAAASVSVAETLRNAGATLRTETSVDRVEGHDVVLEDGERLPFDVLLLAIGLRPPSIIHQPGLRLDDKGHLLLDHHLRCVGHDHLFAAGDATNFVDRPLAKIGVTAVFQGRVLRHNLPAAALGGKLKRYRPRRWHLLILNLGDGRGLATYGPLHWTGRCAMWLKRRIDLHWLSSFRP